MATDSHNSALLKRKRIKSGFYPELEKAITSYLNDVIQYLRQESPFRESVVRERALSIRDSMISTLTERASLDNAGNGQKLLDEARQPQSFVASHGWYQRFMVRNSFSSRKGAGNAKHFEKDFVERSRHEMKKDVAHYPLSCIMNTDEVAVLYRALPSRCISQNGTAYERIKDRLTAVLTVFADGSKAPLTIIGKSKRPRSFPRHFNGPRDLNVYYMAQKMRGTRRAFGAKL